LSLGCFVSRLGGCTGLIFYLGANLIQNGMK
jgi:hypothetical protein